MDGVLIYTAILSAAVGFFIGIMVIAPFHYDEVTPLRAALISHNLGEYYSDEPGAAPDKFRLIENDEQEQQ